jgi:hypothetical protein
VTGTGGSLLSWQARGRISPRPLLECHGRSHPQPRRDAPGRPGTSAVRYGPLALAPDIPHCWSHGRRSSLGLPARWHRPGPDPLALGPITLSEQWLARQPPRSARWGRANDIESTLVLRTSAARGAGVGPQPARARRRGPAAGRGRPGRGTNKRPAVRRTARSALRDALPPPPCSSKVPCPSPVLLRLASLCPGLRPPRPAGPPAHTGRLLGQNCARSRKRRPRRSSPPHLHVARARSPL